MWIGTTVAIPTGFAEGFTKFLYALRRDVDWDGTNRAIASPCPTEFLYALRRDVDWDHQASTVCRA